MKIEPDIEYCKGTGHMYAGSRFPMRDGTIHSHVRLQCNICSCIWSFRKWFDELIEEDWACPSKLEQPHDE